MNWKEFFEDDDKRLSMSRLLVFCAFIVSAPLLWAIGSVEALGVFLGAFVVNYAAGKLSDGISSFSDRGKNVDNPGA